MSEDRLETRCLILEAHTEADAENAYRVESNPTVMQFLGGGYKAPKEQFLRDFPSRSAGCFPGYIAIRRKGDLTYIGNCSLQDWQLTKRNSRTRVAAVQPRIVIDEPFWRYRYGVEALRVLLSYAFETMNAQLVAGIIAPGHPRIRQICMLYGFRQDHSFGPVSAPWCEEPELWVTSRDDYNMALQRLVQEVEDAG
jgi:RimJ/RimL family protein N-acetyltransferase